MAESDIIEYEGALSTDAPFDWYELPTNRWRGTRPPPIFGSCCYVDPSDPTGTTICDDTISKPDCDALSGDYVFNKHCSDNPCKGACCEADGFCEDLSESDCIAAGGDFRGVDTACADTPDPCLGACCLTDPSTPCQNSTEADCTTAGGTFKGLGTSCEDDPNPCPTCPTVQLTCEVKCASAFKCGFPEMPGFESTPPKFYREFQFNTYVHCGGSGTNPDNHCDSEYHEIGQILSPSCYNPTGPCHPFDCYDDVSCSGFSSSSNTFPPSPDCTDDWSVILDTTDNTCQFHHDSSTGTGCFTCWATNAYFESNPVSSVSSVGSGSYNCGGAVGIGTYNETTDLLSEYTTAQLISLVVLPPFTNTFSTSTCSGASTSLSSDERTYQLCKMQYKFIISGTACSGMTISWIEHTALDDGTSSDNHQSWTALGGETESDVFEIDPPSTNGTITIDPASITVDCTGC